MLTKYGAFYDEVTVDTNACGTGEDHDGSVGGELAKRMQEKRQQSLRWLKIVFFGTLFLLLFELLVGRAAGSLTMLADAAHTGSDVVSYGINWLVEWWKSAPGLGNKGEVSAQRAAEAAYMMDTVGCFASVLTLFFATWWASSEAWREFQLPSEGAEHIGSALLLFAVTSSAVNIGMLQMRPRSKRPKDKTRKEASPTSMEGQITPGREAEELESGGPELPSVGIEIEIKDFGFCKPCTPAKAARAARQVEQCSPPEEADSETCQQESSAAKDSEVDTLSSLHMIFHPGCACATSSAPWCPDDPFVEPEAEPETQLKSADYKTGSLNLTAAKVHLLSDMLRNLLILVVALFIQLGIVRDAKHADAVCGLAVAVLVVIGSTAIVLRLAGRLRRMCLRKKPTGEQEKDKERVQG